jgi:DNA-binding NarL/FixJ family response regulator
MESNRRDICILVACKRTVICELYSQALNRHSGFRVVAQALSLADVLREVQRTEIDVALISSAIEEGPFTALSALQQMRTIRPAVKSVLLFDRDESHLVIPAFRAGARGVFCVGKDEFKNLCRCVDRVHAGQVWANSAQLCQLLDSLSHQPVMRLTSRDGHPLLTKREEDVVGLVREGLTNREIARELHLSEHTVRNNLFRIFDKLGVSTRVELALLAVNNANQGAAVESGESIRPEKAGEPRPEFLAQVV